MARASGSLPSKKWLRLIYNSYVTSKKQDVEILRCCRWKKKRSEKRLVPFHWNDFATSRTAQKGSPGAWSSPKDLKVDDEVVPGEGKNGSLFL